MAKEPLMRRVGQALAGKRRYNTRLSKHGRRQRTIRKGHQKKMDDMKRMKQDRIYGGATSQNALTAGDMEKYFPNVKRYAGVKGVR